MSEWINYNSVLLLAIPIVAFFAYVGWTFRQSRRALVGLSIALLVIFIGYSQLRTSMTEIPSGSLVTAIGQGDPIFLEVFSNT